MYYVNCGCGVKCAVEDINPTGRYPVVFVHGWPDSKEIFEYQYDVLPDYGIRCISCDLRGFGDSDRPFNGYSYDRLADDLYRIMESLNVRCCTLVGFQMGGAVCARYMARHNGYKVNKLVLCGAACPQFTQSFDNPNGFTREQVNDLIEGCYEDRPNVCNTFNRISFECTPSEPFFDWFNALCYEAGGPATIKCLESLRDEDLHADLWKIRVPTMILHGREDRVCPFELAEEMHAAIKNSFVVPFEDSGSCLFYDEREKFCDKLVEFVVNY